jgi:thiol-disulfide isomerase/thioredoxin/YHS domain-containing protein
MKRKSLNGRGPSRSLGGAILALALVVPTGPMMAAAWRTDYPEARQEAQSQGKPLLITITASWCGACRQMDQLTFTDSRVKAVVEEKFVAVSVNSDQHPNVVSAFGVSALPTTLVITDGEPTKRWVGFQNAATFAKDLETLVGASSAKPADEFAPVSAVYPSNSPKLGFAGFCLVSLLDNNLLRRGDAKFTADHQGVRVCFHSEEHRDLFVRNPEKYWPVANGNCLVTSQEHHGEQLGDPRVGVMWKGKLWFFADRTRQQQFMRAPERFAPNAL